MDPITHFMTGACLARAGLNRKAAYATLAMTVAAEFPDIDTLWSIRGPIDAFEHHRGITHTLVGIPFEAAIVVGAVYLVHRWRLRRSATHPAPLPPPDPTADRPIPHPLTAAPVRWALLYGFALIALLSHLLLDYTNNYGIRPFFPFNPRWYAGSIVFIVEPGLFAALTIGLAAPSLFGLIAGEVGARKRPFRGRGWAVFALVSMLAIWGVREVEQSAALRLAANGGYGPVTQTEVPQVQRISLSPYPGDPFRWHAVVETADFYQLATVDTRRNVVSTSPEQDILFKPPTTLTTLIAKRSPLGEVYLDWSSWPIVTDIGPAASFPVAYATPAAAPAVTTAVTFRDPRFMYDTFLNRGRYTPPLTGTVYFNEDRRIVGMEFNGRPQR